MKDHIHKVGGMLMFTHLLITDDKLLFGLDTLKTVEAFHEEYNREGKMKAIKAISIEVVHSIHVQLARNQLVKESFRIIPFKDLKGEV